MTIKKSINEWLDKPWTNRSYIRMTGIGCAISAVIYGVVIGYYWYENRLIKTRLMDDEDEMILDETEEIK